MHDRSFRAFLRRAASEPGVKWKHAMVALLGLSLFLQRGLVTLVVAALAGAVISVAIGYPYYRRKGYLWGGSKREPW